MPFYDLKCKCGNEFNIMAKMSEREQKLIKCPECGSIELETVFKSVNIVQSKNSHGGECPNIHKCGGCCGH
ncbi:MAG: zinc ribbon domain-containing protein [Clostridia bacterium]|nr:zinc ribbon domain-containing protein [Clostridia bacterium]